MTDMRISQCRDVLCVGEGSPFWRCSQEFHLGGVYSLCMATDKPNPLALLHFYFLLSDTGDDARDLVVLWEVSVNQSRDLADHGAGHWFPLLDLLPFPPLNQNTQGMCMSQIRAFDSKRLSPFYIWRFCLRRRWLWYVEMLLKTPMQSFTGRRWIMED